MTYKPHTQDHLQKRSLLGCGDSRSFFLYRLLKFFIDLKNQLKIELQGVEIV